ncbi:hypothetical protein L2E82_36259 [Cichorium intybus]|uniref:Uncharacterized protein n=1 Tax=Cichorium intybus TaxID=13427 RepID=A0ACB9BR83_CICIN|nr:hypothetical protein L2E82_36259 [Cichorium intybus]
MDYPEFARSDSMDDSKRELAAFFAHVTHVTDHFCHIEAIDKQVYCEASNEYPCAPNKRYYGRGPLQITYNYNYGAAGRSIGIDMLGNPDIVANDQIISFKTALWFWMENVHSVVGQGFGATIRAINSPACNGGNADQVSSPVSFYTNYCNQFGVSTGPGNLLC